MMWSALDKFTVQSGQFVIGIILARLLMPEDFGLIGMLSIFFAISQAFIDSGMGSGLIQKKGAERSRFLHRLCFQFCREPSFLPALVFHGTTHRAVL